MNPNSEMEQGNISDSGNSAYFSEKSTSANENGNLSEVISRLHFVDSLKNSRKRLRLFQPISDEAKKDPATRRSVINFHLRRHNIEPITTEEVIGVCKPTIVHGYAHYADLQERSLLCLYQHVPVRRFCIGFLKNKWFGRMTIFVILVNCLLMTLYSYCEEQGHCNWKCGMYNAMDQIIFAYFAAEMLCKLIAMGGFGKQGYFADMWNKLDCFIVCTGVFGYFVQHVIQGGFQLTLLRILRIMKRILRPLRVVNRITPMRVVAGLVVKTVPMLANVLLLCFLIFFVFGLIAVQLWAGLWRNRCTTLDPLILNITTQLGIEPVYTDMAQGIDPYICSLPEQDGLHTCQPDNLWNYTTENGNICAQSINDNFNWSSGIPVETPDYCIDWFQYYNTCVTLEENPFMGALSFDNIFYSWITIFVVISTAGWTDIMYHTQNASSFWTWIYFVLLIVIGSIVAVNMFLVVITTEFSSEKARKLIRIAEEREQIISCANEDDADSVASYEDLEEIQRSTYALIIHKLTVLIRAVKHLYLHYFDPEKYAEVEEKSEVRRMLTRLMKRGSMDPDHKEKLRQTIKMKNLILEAIHEMNAEIQGGWPRFRHRVLQVVMDHRFTKVVLLGIVVNTILMALEGHNQPVWIATVFGSFNYVFIVLFAVEMIMKIIGLGFYRYIKDPLNLFDGTIVITSLIEIFQTGSGGLAVLRTFRLLRLVKLIRFLPALLQLFAILAKTMNEIAVFLALLGLVIFIFSLSGTILFGERLCVKADGSSCSCTDLANNSVACFCDRCNFDTFMNSSLTVFQVLTTENWNNVLFSTMTLVGPISSLLYFVALFFIGNYIMMNLVVAILVQACMERTVQQKQAKQKEKAELRELMKRRATSQRAPENAAEVESLVAEEQDFVTAIAPPQFELNPRDDEGVSLVTAVENFAADDQSTSAPSTAQRRICFNDGTTIARQRFNRPYFQDPERNPEVEELHRTIFHTKHCPVDNNIEGHDATNENELPLPKTDYKDLWLKILHVPAVTYPHVCQECYEACKAATQDQDLYDSTHVDEFIDPRITVIPNETEETPLYSKVLQQMRNFKNHHLYQKYFIEHQRWEYSLFICAPNTKVRNTCEKIINNKWFDWAVLGFIFLNCITMTLERPSIDDGSPERIFLETSNHFFTVLFATEMLIKCIALGVVFGPGAYLKSGWNILDGSLVFISIMNVLAEVFTAGKSPQIFEILRVCRMLRALRPLRVINRAPKLKVTVISLGKSIKDVGNILLICATFFFIFGILGVQLFKGKMYYCSGPEIGNVTTKAECLMDTRNTWQNQMYNFDNLTQAVVTLYVVSTFDGWIGIMHQVIDAVGVDMQPQVNHAEWRAVYFVIFIILMPFLVMNMMVAVLVQNYYEANEKMIAEAIEKGTKRKRKKSSLGYLKRRKRKKDNKCQKFIKSLRKNIGQDTTDDNSTVSRNHETRNYGPMSLVIQTLVSHKCFDIFLAIIILLNILVMATEHYNMSPTWKLVHQVSNYMFTLIFIVEAGLKIYGYTIKGYLRNGWNRLDLFIVVTSIIGIFVSELSPDSKQLGNNAKLLRILRMTRIVRVIKLLKSAKGFMSLMNTLANALPQVGNLGILLGLQLFIFSAIGVELFGRIECSPQHPCSGLSNEHANFHNFGMAFLTLFRVATGDSWSNIMADTLKKDCDSSGNCKINCCVTPFFAIIFFVVYVLLTQFILMNIVIAVLMKGFEEAAAEGKFLIGVSELARVPTDNSLRIQEVLEEESGSDQFYEANSKDNDQEEDHYAESNTINCDLLQEN